MNTLFLIPSSWDLTLDSSGNIALATNPYSLAQDVASAIQTYLGEVYFDTTLGIPYQPQILGHGVPLELYRAQCIIAALSVPEVASAQMFFTTLSDRTLQGQIQITASNGQVIVLNVNTSSGESNIFTLDNSLLDGPTLLG